MQANVKSCAVISLDDVVLDVEVDTRSGLPAVEVCDHQNKNLLNLT